MFRGRVVVGVARKARTSERGSPSDGKMERQQEDLSLIGPETSFIYLQNGYNRS